LSAIALRELVQRIGQILQPERFRDYCPNGLQVEGRDRVGVLVSGVTASMDFLEAAVREKADAVLVHHGYFWKGEAAAITGMKRRRIATLLHNECSLLAYHLPLDAHPEYGNNAQLAKVLGLRVHGALQPDDPQGIGFAGALPRAMPAGEFAALLEQRLQRTPLSIGPAERQIRTIGWCTGAAQDWIEHAIALGLDAYLSGEVSERTVHQARENDLHFFAAGHHATERYGVQALGECLAQEFGIRHKFLDLDNPA